jgi:hypothetical protein
MQHYQTLNQWLTTQGTFSQGVQLYNILGKNEYYRTTLFTRKESPFLYDKLKSELQTIFNNLKTIKEVPILQPNNKITNNPKTNNKITNNPITNNPITNNQPTKYTSLSVDDFFNLPQELQRSRMLISQYYAQVIKLRKQIKRQLNLPPALGTVTLQEAYQIMAQTTSTGKAIPFNLLWLTYNEETQKGGETKHLDCVLKFGNKTASRYKSITKKETKNPHHEIHGTINVQLHNTVEIRKLHTWLIFRINNWDVVIGENG